MVLKNKESHQIAQEFSSADERDTFYKTLQKTIDTHNTKHSSKVIDIRNRFKPEKDNFTHQKLKVSQRVFECPENILESIYEYFKSGYYGEEVRTYLDGLSFKKDVNVINVHDMNVIKVELCQLFGSSVASSFTSSIASGIIFCNINGAEYEFALENLNKIIELDQDNSKEYYKYKAMIHDDLKNYQVALSYYEKSIGLFPAEAKREKIKYYARMFRINFSLEHYEDALECCKKAIELNESRNPNHNNKVPLIAKELDYYLGLAGLCTTLKPEKKDKFNEITQEFGAIYKIIAHEAESLEVITKSYAYNAPAYSPLTRIEKIHVVIKAYEIAIDLAINSSDYESAKKYTDEKNKLKNEWGDMRAFL
jgi:tetratricopeptide (TPR) repeat protein